MTALIPVAHKSASDVTSDTTPLRARKAGSEATSPTQQLTTSLWLSILLACSAAPTQSPPTLDISTTAAITQEPSSPVNARWIDQRGGNSLGESIPEGQLTLVAGRRVLVGRDGAVASVAKEVAPLDLLCLAREGGANVIIGASNNQVWRFKGPAAPGQRIAVLGVSDREPLGLECRGAHLRAPTATRGRTELWLNLDGARVDTPNETTAEARTKPNIGDSPVLRWLASAPSFGSRRSALLTAISDGLRVGPERALIVSGSDLFEIDLQTGLPVAVREMEGGASGASLVRVPGGGSDTRAFMTADGWGRDSDGGSPSPLYSVHIPQPFTGLGGVKVEHLGVPTGDHGGAPIISTSGGVLWRWACSKDDLPPKTLRQVVDGKRLLLFC